MVGLPDLIRPARLAPHDEVVGLPVCLRSPMGKGEQGGVEGAHDVVDARVARHGPSALTGDSGDLSVDGGHARPWPTQRQPLDEGDLVRRGLARARVGARLAGETDQALRPVLRHPPLDRAHGQAQLAREARGRDAVVARPQHDEASERLGPFLIIQHGEAARLSDGRIRARGGLITVHVTLRHRRKRGVQWPRSCQPGDA